MHWEQSWKCCLYKVQLRTGYWPGVTEIKPIASEGKIITFHLGLKVLMRLSHLTLCHTAALALGVSPALWKEHQTTYRGLEVKPRLLEMADGSMLKEWMTSR